MPSSASAAALAFLSRAERTPFPEKYLDTEISGGLSIARLGWIAKQKFEKRKFQLWKLTQSNADMEGAVKLGNLWISRELSSYLGRLGRVYP